jgi:Kae1-associated kinase Bud32|tara:strand:- start:1865 stop:2398 length:534 start_codon:yes stop_codon:yes gene_type:complete
MLSEARILLRIKDAGLPVPAVWDVDLENGRIVMERMNGRPLIDILRDDSVPDESKHLALENSGAAVRMLHRMAVTHGDLSTNNILIDESYDAYLIDFGLSAVEYEVERFGIDLHVMDEILGASHPNITDGIEIFLSGYLNCDQLMGALTELSGGMPPLAGEVMKRLEDVRSRVRYHG